MDLQLETRVRRLVTDMNGDVDAAIVEGRRDKEALRKAGFNQQIYTCSETNGLVSFARNIAQTDETVTILTDFDAEGKRLHGKLHGMLPGSMIHPIWRQKLAKLLTETGRRDIESINNLVDK